MNSAVAVDVQMISIFSGVVLPLLVGVVTKQVANRSLKSVLLALFSALSGLAVSAQQGNGIISKEAVVAAFIAWVTAVATYYGLWKPTGTSDKVQEKTTSIGIG